MRLNPTLFADTKLRKHAIQHVLNVDPTGETLEGPHGETCILTRQFRRKGQIVPTPCQSLKSSLDRAPVADPTQGRNFTGRKPITNNRFNAALKCCNALAGFRTQAIGALAA